MCDAVQDERFLRVVLREDMFYILEFRTSQLLKTPVTEFKFTLTVFKAVVSLLYNSCHCLGRF